MWEKDCYIGGMLGVFLAGGLLLVVVSYYYVQLRKQKQYAKRKITILHPMMAEEEKERIRLSQELRDGVSGSLAAAIFYMQTMAQQYPEIAGDISFLKARQLMLTTSSEVSSIAHALSPPILVKAGLKCALEECCAPIFQGNVHVDVQTYGALETLPGNMTLFLFRIAQELLHHIHKHACAHEVIVILGLDSPVITLTIEYDGMGIEASQSDESIISIEKVKQKVNSFQGEITVDPAPERGTVVHVVIPWA